MRVPARLNLRGKSGFVLIAMCSCMFLLLASIGLAFDMGRMYIARNEAQIFADAAAMAAAQQLDGTNDGLIRAQAAARNLPGRWNMAAESFKNVEVQFSADALHWQAARNEDNGIIKVVRDPGAVHYARVALPANDLDITFLRAVGGPAYLNVPAHAVAASKPVRLIE